MPLGIEGQETLRKFVEARNFERGMLVLDLDGTALLEDRARLRIQRLYVPDAVILFVRAR